MLIRFYMSPPANPGGLAFNRGRNRKDRSDPTFSIAPIRHGVNGTDEVREVLNRSGDLALGDAEPERSRDRKGANYAERR